MSTTPSEHQGHCLCGAVKYTATIKERVTACHCGMCRRWTGGLFLSVGADAVTWEGEEHIKTFKSSAWAERGFCSTCGANLFYRVTAPGKLQGMTAIMYGSLEDPGELKVATELFIDRKPPAYALAGQAEHKVLTEAEVMALFGGG